MASNVEITSAYDQLQQLIIADPSLAWAWHCTIAMPMVDSGIEHGLANKAAERIMRLLFQADPTVYTPK